MRIRIGYLWLAAALATRGAVSPALADPAACDALVARWQQTKADLATPQISSVLFAAADTGCSELASTVIAAGASLQAHDRMGNTALAHAARSGQVEVLRVLLAHGADIGNRNAAGGTALFLAAERDKLDAARFLLEHGANPNVPGRSSIAPLSAAAFNADAGLVAQLLAHGADPKAIDSTGKPAIVYAAALGSGPIVDQLLATGIDVNARYGNNLTVLMWASGHADNAPPEAAAKLVADLLARGARVDDADDRGRTALMIAAERGHGAIADLLLAHGADRALRDKQGKTAADLAAADEALRQRLLTPG